jgi:hypothetical protein
MNIQENEVESRKKVGKLNGKPVIEIGLKGGLWLIFASRDGKMEAVGAGPHRAVARHIAKKRTDGEIEFNDLSKADYIPVAHFEWLLPRYEAETDLYAAAFAEAWTEK